MEIRRLHCDIFRTMSVDFFDESESSSSSSEDEFIEDVIVGLILIQEEDRRGRPAKRVRVRSHPRGT